MQIIYLVVPVGSQAQQKVLRAGWNFASADAVDRGDGYAILRRPIKNTTKPEAVLAVLAKAGISAWARAL